MGGASATAASSGTSWSSACDTRACAEGMWRPWAFRPESVTFPLAVVGVCAAFRRPGAAVFALPYLTLSRLPLRDPWRLAGSRRDRRRSGVGPQRGVAATPPAGAVGGATAVEVMPR